ncbi:NDMA-dependent alcohol dehydrogenase [Nocardioides sp. HM23]|nr:NDMA-dependent alcohol dehydrogenase [Nocardioides sp. HM23]MDZ5622374.1 NDMA-dependent alcohol dehydrogenase [Nocardioides sp. HM23]
MKVRAALLREVPGKWEVNEVELDPPREGEVLVRIVANGLCHSDDHFATGDIPVGHLPLCGGHEASGVVEEVGPGVRTLKPGDHVVTAFVPGCGRCRWCAGGQQNLCDNGALMLEGHQLDGSYRMHLDGEPVAQAGLVSGFAEYSVMPEYSCVPIGADMPLELASLLGCAVPTGWGSAVNAAAVRPGDVIVVMGAGGIGIAAVQGAAHAGAARVVVVEPVTSKHDLCLDLGATDVFTSVDEATELVRSLTNGQGADAAIICVGVLTSADVGAAFGAIRKAGTVVVTAAAPGHTTSIDVAPLELTMYQKRVQGSIYGMMSPSKDVPRLVDMWRSGALKLREMITQTYGLDEINQGYADMHAGLNFRGVLVPA